MLALLHPHDRSLARFSVLGMTLVTGLKKQLFSDCKGDMLYEDRF
jgi:hypothetical protein